MKVMRLVIAKKNRECKLFFAKEAAVEFVRLVTFLVYSTKSTSLIKRNNIFLRHENGDFWQDFASNILQKNKQ